MKWEVEYFCIVGCLLCQNECFYDMRKALDRKPYNFLSNYKQIINHIDNIYLLIETDQIIGSIACYGNEVDDLIVNKNYQKKGYGKNLLLFAMNLIRKSNNDPIILHVAKWNENALNYTKMLGL